MYKEEAPSLTCLAPSLSCLEEELKVPSPLYKEEAPSLTCLAPLLSCLEEELKVPSPLLKDAAPLSNWGNLVSNWEAPLFKVSIPESKVLTPSLNFL